MMSYRQGWRSRWSGLALARRADTNTVEESIEKRRRRRRRERPGYWEINLAAIVEQSLSERRTEQPLADINYGVGRRIQLKFEIPWLHVREHGESAGTGPGNADYGVKWRFLGEEGKRVAWSI
jgi:hypothetical protein